MTARLVRFNGLRTGVLSDGDVPAVVDVAASLDALGTADADLLRSVLDGGRGSWEPLIESWASVRGPLEGLARAAAEPGTGDGLVVSPLEQVTPEPPLPSLELRIFAAGGNFADHVAGINRKQGGAGSPDAVRRQTLEEKAAGTPPWGFLVLPTLVQSEGAEVRRPRETRFLDYEAEVAAVLASGGRDLRPEQVRFWGVAPFNDFSLRDSHEGAGVIDRGPLLWGLSKNFESGKMCGRWLSVPDALDVDRLDVVCRVNGEQRQAFCTADMLYSFAELAAFLSRFITLRAGDIVTSGTGPGTAADSVDDRYLRPGDRVEVEVAGAGTLRNTVVG